MKKLLLICVTLVLLLGSVQVAAYLPESQKQTVEQTIHFSQPKIIDNGEYLQVELQETTTYLNQPGYPKLPIYEHTFILPFKSKINSLDCTISYNNQRQLTKKIQPVSTPQPISLPTKNSRVSVTEDVVYSYSTWYPKRTYDYRVGAGLHGKQQVTFLTVYCYPTRYDPSDNHLSFANTATIAFSYSLPTVDKTVVNNTDLVIISPETFSNAVSPLVDHKVNHGLSTIYMSTEEIYAQYPGRDNAEQIKYYIKDAVETFGASYVLLVGSIYMLPMRASQISLWQFEDNVITDLYYADIYDHTGSFCSWDSNNNDLFGEEGQDQVDLYPDVYIGRLPCDTIAEVNIVVDKIIHYETETNGEQWFNNMIYIGGDTFPRWGGNEGEQLNSMIMDIMTEFTPAHVIWTSENNFNRRTISQAINEGAGFLDYSGHGFEHGMGTYPPDGRYLRTYLTPYLKDLSNGNKLPIIFFDACLTAKLDFVLKDILSYKQYWMFYLAALLLQVDVDMKLPVYAWSFLKHENGGAIATIGATRTAYGGVDSGAGKLSLEFFQAYTPESRLGEMMVEMQNHYIQDVPDDAFTVEEFILIGDPSLQIGGY